MKNTVTVTLLFVSTWIFAQNSILYDNLKHHVYYLSDDSLEGRATGSKGEQMAYDYIIREFKKSNVDPGGKEGSFLQPFTFIAGREYGTNNSMTINGEPVSLDKDYYPIAYSFNGTVEGEAIFVEYGIDAPEIDYDDYKDLNDLEGKIFVIDIASPDGDDPHSKYGPYMDMRKKVEVAQEKGAIGVVFIDVLSGADDPSPMFDKNIYPLDIPVVYLKEHIAKDWLKRSEKRAAITVDLKKIEKTGHNVLGWIDNGANQTVVVGAHYDHLGYGESGGSLYRGEPAIHNGADDNASGTALLIELAKELKSSTLTDNNYLFIAFSGEELGLYGSNHYVNNPTAPVGNINYMLNYDMVGRLDTAEKILQLNGAGTSSTWKGVIDEISGHDLEIKTSESGTGPSDHMSFYLKEIPVLHVFTGTHGDYHKPSDDAELVNVAGIIEVMEYSMAIVEALNDDGKLDYVETKEESYENTPRFTVTLGIIPNYIYEEKGLKVDGVTEGKPAFKAGMKKGDVIIKMGDTNVTDIMSYMKALSLFKAGDKTVVRVDRNGKEVKLKVKF